MVTDKTGLMGLYDWEIKFDPQVLMQIASQIDVTLLPGSICHRQIAHHS
jgi:hypothetical protein